MSLKTYMGPSKKIGFALGLLLFALPALGADLAILRNGFSIRHERRETVGSMTRLYLGTDKGYVDIATDQIERFDKDLTPVVVPASVTAAAPSVPSTSASGVTSALASPARASSRSARVPPLKPEELKQVINSISGQHHIDPDFISSVIHAESGFNQHAVSPKGAQGLMQLMPGTASKLGVANAFDPRSNVEGGTKYLTELLERYNFDVIKALAAYNAGPLRVQQYGGVPPYRETQAYVASIVRDYNRKKIAQRKAAAAVAKTNHSKKPSPPPAVEKRASISALVAPSQR